MGDDREEIARIIDPVAFAWAANRHDYGKNSISIGCPWTLFDFVGGNKLGRIQEAYAKADAILARAQGPGPGEAVADGWVIVPREPTEAMLAAMDRKVRRTPWPDGNGTDIFVLSQRDRYRAMIAATPTRGGVSEADHLSSARCLCGDLAGSPVSRVEDLPRGARRSLGMVHVVGLVRVRRSI